MVSETTNTTWSGVQNTDTNACRTLWLQMRRNRFFCKLLQKKELLCTKVSSILTMCTYLFQYHWTCRFRPRCSTWKESPRAESFGCIPTSVWDIQKDTSGVRDTSQEVWVALRNPQSNIISTTMNILRCNRTQNRDFYFHKSFKKPRASAWGVSL